MRSLVAAILLAFPSALLAAQGPDRLTLAQAQQRYQAGQEFLFKDAFAAAIEEFRMAIELDPTLALAHYGLGQAHMGLKEYPEAVRAFTRCRAAFTEAVASSIDRGERTNRWIEDEIRGLRDRQQLIEAELRRAGGANALLQRALRQIMQRITQLEHLRQRHDRSASVPAGVSLALGSAYLRAGQLPEAEREYLAALEGNSRMGEAHNNLAYVYMVTGRLAEAERELKLAEKSGFKVHPDFKQELRQKLQ